MTWLSLGVCCEISQLTPDSAAGTQSKGTSLRKLPVMGKVGIAWSEIPSAPTAGPGKEKTQWKNVPKSFGETQEGRNLSPQRWEGWSENSVNKEELINR